MPRGKNGEISFDDRELDLRREILEILPPYEGGGVGGGEGKGKQEASELRVRSMVCTIL